MVCTHVHNTLNSPVIEPDVERQTGVEDVWAKIQCRKLLAIIIGCVYRHYDALVTSFDYIQYVCRTVCSRDKSVFFLDDFHDDMMTTGNIISKILNNNKLTQIIDKSTRTTSTPVTLMDLIITNKPDAILSQDVFPPVVADHDLVSFVQNVKEARKLPVVKLFVN